MGKRALPVFLINASRNFASQDIDPWCKGTNFSFSQFLLSTCYPPWTGLGPGRYREAQGMTHGLQEHGQGLWSPDLSRSLLGPTGLFSPPWCMERQYLAPGGQPRGLSLPLLLSLPTLLPLADWKGARGNLRDSVLFVLGSMESHLHVLIATNWH